MNAREMQVEFERRITLMNPAFELKEKLTSDTIFSFLNAYTERFVRNNYLQEDQVADGTRAQKKNADALKGLIVRTLLSRNQKDIQNTDVNSEKFVLPADYFLYIRSNSRVSATYKGLVENVPHVDVEENQAIDYFMNEEVESTGTNTDTWKFVYDGDTLNILLVDGTGIAPDAINNLKFYLTDDLVKTVNNYNIERVKGTSGNISKISFSLASLKFDKCELAKDETAVATFSVSSYQTFSDLDVDDDTYLDFLQIVPNSTIREDDVEKIISTYYNRAILRSPYVVLNSGRADDITDNTYLNIIHDTYTVIEAVDLVYYRKPKRFDVIGVDGVNVLDHCELPENVHMELVEGAVEMFITEAKYRLNMRSND